MGFAQANQARWMAKFFVKLEPCLICMGACGSAHYWERKLGSFGHIVKLMTITQAEKGNAKNSRKIDKVKLAIPKISKIPKHLNLCW
ncbi:MAG: hypothetical protein B7Z65_09520 [Ferrovum sp. 21-44-67]|nr:MAG: hypothetical protein B7Z65_09520 [Ferrovum sp. 21-44-67]